MFKRNRFVWNEPWFFLLRIRHPKAWINLAVILLVVAAGTGTAFFFLMRVQPPLLHVVGLSFAVTALVWAFIDGPSMRRTAILDSDSLYVDGDFGKFSRHERYKISGIQLAVIRRAEQLQWPFPALFFVFGGETVVVGINRGISLARLASAMRALNIPVELEGWDPNAESDFQKTFKIEATDPSAIKPTGRVEPIDPGEPKLWTPLGMTIAIIQQCWAGAMAIASIVASVIYLYRNWKQLGLVEVVLAILIPIAVMYVAGVITERFGSASANNTVIKNAIKQIRRRRNVTLRIDDPKTHPVEVLKEDQFANTVQRIHEVGFIDVDTERRHLAFEGKKERWLVPAESMRGLFINEVQSGAGGDAAFGAMNYYVVLEFDTPEKAEKFGFRCGKREFGTWTDVKRAQHAIELFEVVAPLM